MFQWFRRRFGSKQTSLTFPAHYKQTAQSAPGKPCEVTLAGTRAEGSVVELVYKWESNLPHDEADRLDSRLRAFIACAIYDAAKAAQLGCEAGPAHGRRPAWIIESGRIAVSVVQGGFDADEKMCYVSVGPVMRVGPPVDLLRMMGADNTPSRDPNAYRLASGFAQRFSQICV